MDHFTYFHFYKALFLRYAIVAGVSFLVFYVLFSKKFQHRKIQKLSPKRKDFIREISASMVTLTLFAFYGYSLKSSFIHTHSQLYSNIHLHGWVYFFASIFLALLIHDTYFYWAHRLMHNPKIFKIVHLMHHRSTNPTPWAAYAFHPLEAIVEGMVIWIIVFTIPIHAYAIVVFMLIMITYNVYGHLGYEIYPQWVINSPVGKWLNTSTNHNMHHKYFNDNYGLYFRFWDEMMKTTNPNYQDTINTLVSQQKNNLKPPTE